MDDIKWSPPLIWGKVYNQCFVGRHIKHVNGQAFRVEGKFPDEELSLSWLSEDGTVGRNRHYSLINFIAPYFSVEILTAPPLEDFL